MSPVVRSRMIGAMVLAAVFVAGLLAGYAIARRPNPGVEINIRATSELPKELRDLGLTPAQRDTIGRLLLEGRRKAVAVLRDLEPRMQAAMDSLDQAIDATLTPDQRARLEAARKRRSGSARMRDTNIVVVDTSRTRRP